MVIVNVDAVYDGHVSNHSRFFSHGAVYFIFSVSIMTSLCPSPFCYFLKLCVPDLGFSVANSSRASPNSFRWPN